MLYFTRYLLNAVNRKLHKSGLKTTIEDVKKEEIIIFKSPYFTGN